MDIVGKWKIYQMFADGGDRLVLKPLDELIAAADNESEKEELLNLGRMITEYTADGKVLVMAPIPDGVSQEEIDEAVASGQIQLTEDKKFFIDGKILDWKTEDGVIKINTGMEGTIMGEAADPYSAIEVIDDDHFQFAFQAYERIK